MTYRDDRDALREEVRRLEQRIADADREVARLRGEAESPAVDEVRAFRALALDRVIARPLTERRAIELERLWRARLPSGMRVERHGLRVTAGTPGLTIEAAPDASGGTRLSLKEDVQALRRVWVLIAVSITLTLGSMAPLALRASGPVGMIAIVAALTAISALPLGAWTAKRRRRQLARVFEASAFVLSEIEPREASSGGIRVAGEDPDLAVEAQASEEALRVEKTARERSSETR